MRLNLVLSAILQYDLYPLSRKWGSDYREPDLERTRQNWKLKVDYEGSALDFWASEYGEQTRGIGYLDRKMPFK